MFPTTRKRRRRNGPFGQGRGFSLDLFRSEEYLVQALLRVALDCGWQTEVAPDSVCQNELSADLALKDHGKNA